MIADRLKGLRKQNHMTQTALAERLNVTQTAISQWETDRTRPDQELLGKIASIFSVSVDYLLGENTDKNGDSSDYFRVPVFGSIPAGVPIEAIEDIEGYVEMQSVPGYNNREFFALRLSGNSMSPEYRNGDVVIFHAQETCESGQDCGVIVDNEDATFKRVRFSEKGLILQPLNPDYEPIVFSNRDLDGDTVRVLGIGWEVRRKLIK